MESIWKKTTDIPRRESLTGTIQVKTAVIGAGMAGLLTAYMLKERGIETVVLEAGRIAGGQTGNTTAKITSQHNLIYAYLIEKFGEKKAWQYAHINEKAIDRYQEIIEKEQIECSFERCSSYLYALGSEKKRELEKENDAAQKLGIQTRLTLDTKLPFPVSSALEFKNQAQFHPLQFLNKLCERLTIYEESKVLRVEEHEIFTEKGTVRAEHIVFAVHYPWQIIPGYYFMRMHQERSYVIALQLPDDWEKMSGMYLGVEEEGYSFRICQYEGRRALLLGGKSHRTGENKSGGKYEALRKQAKEWFPGCKEIACWSAQDCISMDKIPYIGAFSADMPGWYVATGFCKWGMSSSMAAASILSDLISGKENEYEEVFTPQRFPAAALSKNFTENILQAAKGLSKQAFLAEEFPGKCPHLGCKLEKNADENTWECPCHGSCFTKDGRLLTGPAQRGLCEGSNTR